jgi:hypothetical protein
MLTKLEAIKHILQLCEAYKTYMHWQVTARIALGSLYLDERITEEDRDLISEDIGHNKLYDYDYLLADTGKEGTKQEK